MRKYLAAVAVAALFSPITLCSNTAVANTGLEVSFTDSLNVSVATGDLKVVRKDEGTTIYSSDSSEKDATDRSASTDPQVEAYEVRTPFDSKSEMSEGEIEDWTDDRLWEDSDGSTEIKKILAKPLPESKPTSPQVSRIDTPTQSIIKWPDSVPGQKVVLKDGVVVGSTSGSEVVVDATQLEDRSTLQVSSRGKNGEPASFTLPSVQDAKLNSEKMTISAVSHKSFIPYEYVKLSGLKALGCSFNSGGFPKSAIYHNGNNRDFMLPKSYRTVTEEKNYKSAMFARVAWEGPDGGRYIETQKGVGATKLYDSKKKLLATRTATSKKMLFKDATKGSSLARITFDVEVGNPFCVTGAIRHRTNFVLHRSGVIEVGGQGRDVPNHEIAGFGAAGDSFKWGWLDKSVLNSFDCLVSNRACKPQNWNGKVKLP